MMFLTCSAVRRRLPAFYDRELPVPDMIAIGGHVADCPPCASELRDLKRVGEVLRLAAAPAPADDWTGVQSGVIGRMRAEAHESWTAKAGRMFDDLHLLWIGLAATAATFLCGAVALSALHFASPDRDDSLRSMLAVDFGAGRIGSEPDHRRPVPDCAERAESGTDRGHARAAGASHDDSMLAFSAVVTREGRLSRVSVLNNERHPRK